jgi:ketosteroid isomerase-like protein
VKTIARVVVSLLAGAVHAAPQPPAAPALSAAECQVWERERSFARSVQDGDHAAFAEHVHADAAFLPGATGVVRGRTAVAADWAGLIDGKEVKLRWHPERVVIAGDPDTAISQGPYWMDDTRPDAKQRWSTGKYNSVWSRGADGIWHVIFDGGGAPPRPSSAEEIAKIEALLPKECPRAGK